MAQANILALSLVGGLVGGVALVAAYEATRSRTAPAVPPPAPGPLPPAPNPLPTPGADEPFARYADELIATSRMQAATLPPEARGALADALSRAADNIRLESPLAAARLDAEAAVLRGRPSAVTGQEQFPIPPSANRPLISDADLARLRKRAEDYVLGRSMGLEDSGVLLTALENALGSFGPGASALCGLVRLVTAVRDRPEASPVYASPL